MGAAIPGIDNTLEVANSKYARIERERRFLLRELPEDFNRAAEHVQIWDNYITNTRLRLRKVRYPKTNQWITKLTQKYAIEPGDLSRTKITNTYLSATEYEVLSVFEGNEIRKNRYPFEHEGRKYSVDIFIGDLLGLILAETDFGTDEELDSFTMPSFAFREVTEDPMFTGGSLVLLTADDIRKRIYKQANGIGEE
jgi:CYTH domain-containing protein